MLNPNSTDIRAKFLGKLAQLEENLENAVAEFPAHSALDRVKFALALITFIRTQVGLDTDAAAQSAHAPGSRADRHDQ